MERLSIILAQKAGYEIVLWTNSDIKNVPPGTTIKFIPDDVLKPIGFCGIPPSTLPNGGIGSFSHWSDYFAFYTLKDTGGYWMQLDIAILKRIAIDKPYAFIRWGDGIGPAFMKLPPQSDYAKTMVEVLKGMVSTGLKGMDWHWAMIAMNDYARAFNILDEDKCYIITEGYRDCGGGGPSPYNLPAEQDYNMIHWSNATYNTCKTTPIIGSEYRRLCVEANLI
jgi:hypothetical protein